MTGQPLRMDIDFPFEGGTFPPDLGALISRTVVDGKAPVLYVAHTHDNRWVITDAFGDPNAAGALLVACIWHAIEGDSSLTSLADLPLGVEAVRDSPGEPWRSRRYEEEE